MKKWVESIRAKKKTIGQGLSERIGYQRRDSKLRLLSSSPGPLAMSLEWQLSQFVFVDSFLATFPAFVRGNYMST